MNYDKEANPPPRKTPVFGMAAPCALAFIASFCIMVVELVAGRIIARHVGQSLYTWTSVIGIVLGGITLGNLCGGRLADWFAPRKTLAALFLLAALASLSIPAVNEFAGDDSPLATWLEGLTSWPLRIAIHVTVVFLLPSTILGLIGPVVAKMALDLGRSTGKTVGNVYAWGALGSIVGTFVTGFYLIALMKTTGVIFAVAGVLGVVGIVLLPFFAWPFFAACLLGGFLALGGKSYWAEHLQLRWDGGTLAIQEKVPAGAVYVDESQYSYIKVTEDPDGARDLILDDLIHAHWVPDNPLDLRYEYEKIYAAVSERAARGRSAFRTFFLGGGGYIFPRYVQARWPGSYTEVAEIDPGVTRAVMLALGLREADVRINGPRAIGLAGLVAMPPDGEGTPEDAAPDDEAPADEVPEDGGSPDAGSPSDGALAAADAGDPGSESASGEAGASGGSAPSAGTSSIRRPIEIHHMDARNRVHDLARASRSGGDFEPFDFVYGDAFNDFSVPFHLVTREFTEKIRDILRPETGVYMVNIIDIYASSRFVGAVYNTAREVFPHAYVLVTSAGGPSDEWDQRDTFVVVGAFQPLDLENLGTREGDTAFEGTLLGAEHLEQLRERSEERVLTDDHSPVENLLEVVVRGRAHKPSEETEEE